MKPAEIIPAAAYRDGIGVRVPQRRLVAKKFWPQVKLLSKKERWQLIDKMLSGSSEEVTIGLDWLWRSRALFKKNDLAVFDNWMLKETSDHNQKEVFTFVMKHKTKMPRTALRYAIEKFPRKLKQQAMTL